MLESMTGFGRSEQTSEAGTVLVEVRSVNGRYLKVQLRLPDLLASYEGEVERLVRSRVGRGTVSVTMHAKAGEEAVAWRLNPAVVKAYAEALEALRAEIGPDSPPLRLEALALLPGAVEEAAALDVGAALWPLAAGALQEALDQLLAMRRTEGQALTQALLAHAAQIDRMVAAIAARAPDVLTGYRDRIAARVQELLADLGVTVTEADLARELALFAERSDIAEELNRLKSHVDQFRSLAGAESTGADDRTPGRTLEFLIQEMLREANTIGSKANDVAIGREVVALKSEIDRMKEQIQNMT